MAGKTDTQYVKSWRFINRKAFEKSIVAQTEDLVTDAQELYRLFQQKVEQWEAEILETQPNRFVAETTPPPKGRLVKSPTRIAQKIIDSWREYDEWTVKPKSGRGSAPQKHDPVEFLTTMADIIRFRIVCSYLNDVYAVDKRLKEYVDSSEELRIISRKDFTETPFPDRRGGHRAIQYAVRMKNEKRSVLFEVQIMTQLQHAWDKKDHHLIYEYGRDGRDKKIPVHVKNRMAAMSELLYVADTTFDTLREQIATIMKEGKK